MNNHYSLIPGSPNKIEVLNTGSCKLKLEDKHLND